MPSVNGLLEAAVYVADLDRSVRFYEDVMGFRRMWGDQRGVAFAVAEKQVFLVFLKGGSTAHIPPHDGDGRLHAAFSIAAAELNDWERHLAAKGVAVEHRTTWPKGGASLYFRDPDGHLLEVVTPGVWDVY